MPKSDTIPYAAARVVNAASRTRKAGSTDVEVCEVPTLLLIALRDALIENEHGDTSRPVALAIRRATFR